MAADLSFLLKYVAIFSTHPFLSLNSKYRRES